MGLLTLKINKFFVYKVFYFLLVFLSIFRERIAIPIWPYYIKIMETYIAITIPLILFIFMKKVHFFCTTSAFFILIVFIIFFGLNYISSHISSAYTLTGEYVSCTGTEQRFSGPPIEHEAMIYCFRLGLVFLITLIIIIGLTPNYHLLIGSIYNAFIIAGLTILIWSMIFPSYTKTTLARFTGPIGDPNFAASFLIISMNISTYFMLVSRNRLIRIGNLLLSGAFFTAIVISLSRGALLGAMFSLIALFFAVVVSNRSCFIRGALILKKTYSKRTLPALSLVIIFVMVLFAAWPTLFTAFVQRLSIENIVSEKDQSRQSLWRLGLHSIAENPIGYGMGQMEKKHALLDPDRSKFGHSTSVHNVVLQVGGAFGWLGMFIFIMFLFFLLRVCVRLLRKKTYMADSVSTCPVPLATSFIGLFVQSMLFNFLFLKYFWMVGALVLSYYEYDKRNFYSKLRKKENLLCTQT